MIAMLYPSEEKLQARTGSFTQAYRSARVCSFLRCLAVLLPLCLGFLLAGQGAWIHAKGWLSQVLLERAFDRSVASGVIVRPWPWLDTYPVARISVPRLGKTEIVLDGSSGQALAFGPGHVDSTGEAGEVGTAVYAAHRDTHFAFLGDMRNGDDIEVTRRDGTIVHYRVTGHAVRPWNSSGIDPNAPGRHLVMVTCWPLNALARGPLRYLVTAEWVPTGPNAQALK